MGNVTNGLVCAHHHLYSSLARGMPAPPETPVDFVSILRNVWWRLDAALDLDIIRWSAALGAAEALLSGTTAIIDHHESPSAIEGSLDAVREGCEMVGVRHSLCYGVTDRWTEDGMTENVARGSAMTDAARRGLTENERYLRAGGRGMVGVHAAFTCSDETLEAAAGLASDLGTGVHIHVAEGPGDADAGERLSGLARDNWLLVHCVNLRGELPGTIAHNPRSNMNNAVGYARPAARPNTVVLGTDGIGADMMDEARLAYVCQRNDEITATPDTAWNWLANGEILFPEVAGDRVEWSYDHADSPWHAAFTTSVRAVNVSVDGNELVRNGVPTGFDLDEIRCKATEAAARLHARL
ncbi:MAG: hypothetical protein RLZZ305_1580 [Actinomycetota bacterium]|jgi:cytosine/adenosine deaminase-related metal-dependent hydrolase